MILDDPTTLERCTPSPVRYEESELHDPAVMHSDSSVLVRRV